MRTPRRYIPRSGRSDDRKIAVAHLDIIDKVALAEASIRRVKIMLASTAETF
jgi:hypothetical protein